VLEANPGGFAKTVHVPMTPPSAGGPLPPFDLSEPPGRSLIQAPPKRVPERALSGVRAAEPAAAVVGVALFVLTNAAIVHERGAARRCPPATVTAARGSDRHGPPTKHHSATCSALRAGRSASTRL